MLLCDAIETSFPLLERLFDDESLRRFASGDYGDLDIHCLFLGAWMRDNLLAEDSAIYALFRIGGVSHKDDMCMLLLQLFYIDMRTRGLPRMDSGGLTS